MPAVNRRFERSESNMKRRSATSGVIRIPSVRDGRAIAHRRSSIPTLRNDLRRRERAPADGASLAEATRGPGRPNNSRGARPHGRVRPGRTRVVTHTLYQEESHMIRTALSLAAAAMLVATQAPSIAAAQAKQSATAAKPAGAVVNINTASATEFATLPGIGDKTAARIIEYRQKNGPFKKIEDLMNVRGIGEKNFLKLKPQLTVGAVKADHDRPNQ